MKPGGATRGEQRAWMVATGDRAAHAAERSQACLTSLLCNHNASLSAQKHGKHGERLTSDTKTRRIIEMVVGDYGGGGQLESMAR